MTKLDILKTILEEKKVNPNIKVSYVANKHKINFNSVKKGFEIVDYIYSFYNVQGLKDIIDKLEGDNQNLEEENLANTTLRKYHICHKLNEVSKQ